MPTWTGKPCWKKKIRKKKKRMSREKNHRLRAEQDLIIESAPVAVRSFIIQDSTTMPLIFDAHEDIAYNMLTFGRDYRRSTQETHQLERGTPIPGVWGDSLLGWPDYQRGQVALIFGTLFIVPQKYKEGNWDTQTYATPAQAHHLYQNQIDLYNRLCDENPDKFKLVRSRKELDDVLSAWDRTPADYPNVTHPVGLVLSMEGAEGIRAPEELEEWWEAGLRLVGPVWAGTRFCGGMYQPGPFSQEGFELLDVMAELRYTLDVSHFSGLGLLQRPGDRQSFQCARTHSWGYR
jgi:membrane dipeptidase